jgi:hypothetical protein
VVRPVWVELGALSILLVFALFSEGVRLRDALFVAAGAWMGEEVCIRLYGAYQYAPGWTVFVDRVPLAVVLIWPAVVLSARAVQRSTGVPVFFVVLFDACLVEPIATHAGLWSWNLPGAFGVPLIGPVGWACYAAAACLVLDRAPRWTSVAAPLLAHAGILVAFWGALRWMRFAISPGAAAGVSALVCTAAALVALRAPRLPWRDAAPRAAAAALFAALLYAAPDRALLLYAAPFALPWLALLDWTPIRIGPGAESPPDPGRR